MKDKTSIDFWPGYVDAMVNILLNLLFLAGIFTTGLVMFNAQSIINKKQELLIKAQEKAITSESIKEVTQEVTQEVSKPKILEIKKIEKIKIEPEVSKEIKEFRFKKQIVTNNSSVNLNSFEKFVYEQTGSKILNAFEFKPEQLYWTKDVIVSEEALNSLQKGSMLVVLTKLDDSRLTLEAYTRMVSLRTLLIQKYGLPKTPEIRIVAHGLLGNEKLLERHVFLVDLPNKKNLKQENKNQGE